MSAHPLFWPASRAAARRRVSRRGFLLVAGLHLAALAGVVLLSAGPAKVSVAAGRQWPPADTAAPPSAPTPEGAVVWMDPATFEAPLAAVPPPAAEPAPTPEPSPEPSPPPAHPAPVREPFLAPAPRPASVRPKPTAAAAGNPRKSLPPPPAKVRPAADRPPSLRPHPQPVRNSGPVGRNLAGSQGGGTDPGADPTDAGEPAGAGGTDWYASMLHERFHAHWEQPTSVFASAQRYTATLRLRIERDGRISDCRLVRSSGLVPMDESVLAAAARVGRVDPPPVGLLRGGAYVVNVGFVRE